MEVSASALKVTDYQFENGGPLGPAKTIYERQVMVRFWEKRNINQDEGTARQDSIGEK